MNAKETLDKLKDLLNLSQDNKIINLSQIAKIEKWYLEVENDTFAVGNKIIRKWWDNETEPLAAGEYELAGGEKMMVDSSGIITSIDNNVKLSKKINMENEVKDLQAKLDLAVNEKKELQTKYDELSEKLNKLEAAQSEKIEAEKTELSQVEKLAKIVEDLSNKVTELSKEPVIEKEEKDLTKLSYVDRMWEQNK